MEDIYKPGSVLDLPRRPPWDYHMTKAEVEMNEEAVFRQYLRAIYAQHTPKELSFFEHNLEVRGKKRGGGGVQTDTVLHLEVDLAPVMESA